MKYQTWADLRPWNFKQVARFVKAIPRTSHLGVNTGKIVTFHLKRAHFQFGLIKDYCNKLI